MRNNRRGSYALTRLTVHVVWLIKYRYKMLKGNFKKRCRDLIRQDCSTMEIEILKGVVSEDYIHIHIEFPPKLSVSEIMKQLKGRSYRIL